MESKIDKDRDIILSKVHDFVGDTAKDHKLERVIHCLLDYYAQNVGHQLGVDKVEEYKVNETVNLLCDGLRYIIFDGYKKGLRRKKNEQIHK
jgi:hypothetical protein